MLKQDIVTFNHKNIVNIYIVYEINLLPFREDDHFTLASALFGALELTKNVGKDKYKYSDYGTGFDNHETSSLLNGSGFGKNIIIFGVDMNSSAKIY